MKLHYAIFKTLEVTATEIQKAIEECREIPGVAMDMYADGWIYAEPEGMKIERWKRDKSNYRIETID